MAIYVPEQPGAGGHRLVREHYRILAHSHRVGFFVLGPKKEAAREEATRKKAKGQTQKGTETMIISMKLHSTREEIDEVTGIVKHYGYKVHSIEGEERVVIGVVGVGDVTACMESVEAMPQVEKVVRITAPYKFVRKEFRPGKTRIKVNGAEIGGDEFAVIAGPCSVESEDQIMRSAEAVAKAGAKFLRGGAFKPRTSPYDFQGMEEEGLKLLL